MIRIRRETRPQLLLQIVDHDETRHVARAARQRILRGARRRRADKTTAELELTAAANAAVGDKPDVQVVGTATGAANQQGLSPTVVLKVVK